MSWKTQCISCCRTWSLKFLHSHLEIDSVYHALTAPRPDKISQLTIQKRRLLKPLLVHLTNRHIKYRWSFPFRLSFTHKGKAHSFDDREEILLDIGLIIRDSSSLSSQQARDQPISPIWSQQGRSSSKRPSPAAGACEWSWFDAWFFWPRVSILLMKPRLEGSLRKPLTVVRNLILVLLLHVFLQSYNVCSVANLRYGHFCLAFGQGSASSIISYSVEGSGHFGPGHGCPIYPFSRYGQTSV